MSYFSESTVWPQIAVRSKETALNIEVAVMGLWSGVPRNLQLRLFVEERIDRGHRPYRPHTPCLDPSRGRSPHIMPTLTLDRNSRKTLHRILYFTWGTIYRFNYLLCSYVMHFVCASVGFYFVTLLNDAITRILSGYGPFVGQRFYASGK